MPLGKSNRTPLSIVRRAERMRREIGIEPAVAPRTANRWRITVESERVVVVIDYELVGQASHWVGSALTVDGKRSRPARDLEQLAAFFRNPATAFEVSRGGVVVPEPAGPKGAPSIAIDTYVRLSKLARGRGVCRLSHPDWDCWRAGVYLANSFAEANFTGGKGRWGLDKEWPLRLIIGETDRSNEVQTPEDALHLLLEEGEQPSGSKTDS